MEKLIQVAVLCPVRTLFDYLAPNSENVVPGTRVLVPFGRQEKIGVVFGNITHSSLAKKKLKRPIRIIDINPIIPEEILDLCQFISSYYHYPIGEVLKFAIPKYFRSENPRCVQVKHLWEITLGGREQLKDMKWQKKAPNLAALLEVIRQKEPVEQDILKTHFKSPASMLKKLLTKQLVSVKEIKPEPFAGNRTTKANKLPLNQEQLIAFNAIAIQFGNYNCFLLEGVTGSGKTEVYLQLIEKVLANKQQVLVLVPEINLTPQILNRFQQRFNVPIGVLHSKISEKKKASTWQDAKENLLPIVIGTRSAVFTPMPALGLIIVDEEHDMSFKQQDSCRYCARDLAVTRAYRNQVPIILGSATPSLESLQNVEQKKYVHLQLTQRAGQASPPQVELIDMSQQKANKPLCHIVLQQIKQHLALEQQVLVFLNRRGYAPALLCPACNWIAKCPRCEIPYTYHKNESLLRCHHCSKSNQHPKTCPNCQTAELIPLGVGTQKLEDFLQENFPETHITRIDSDSVTGKTLSELLPTGDNSAGGQILIGTQMLAKGHHFPKLTLVVLADIDSGLFNNDYLATERFGQLLIQVIGRAGRGDLPGKVLIQTRYPAHPLLKTLLASGYPRFAQNLLRERAETQLPPYYAAALVRSESTHNKSPTDFLNQFKHSILSHIVAPEIQCLGPIPAPMPKKQGKFRAQLLILCKRRAVLNQLLSETIQQVEQVATKHKTRWSIDIDPKEIF